MVNLVKLVALLAAVLPLGSCTTLSTGILAAPPGLNRNSFRECLLDRGFFTPTALVGTASDDYHDRHSKEITSSRSYSNFMNMGNGQFIVETTGIIFKGLLAHQQFGGVSTIGLLDSSADRPYGINVVGHTPYPSAGYPTARPPDVGDDQTLPENKMNLYLDCYMAPVGVEDGTQSAGLPSRDLGDYDIEGRVLRAHILLALLAQYGTEVVTSHASGKQPAYAAMLLKDIGNAELELRLASPVMNTDKLKLLELADLTYVAAPASAPVAVAGAPPPMPNAVVYPRDDFVVTQPVLRWDDQVVRILRVFQVAQDDETIDASQSLDRLTNIIAAFSKPTLGAFKGLLKDSLKGLGAMQKVSLYGDALLRDGRETLAIHRRTTTLVATTGSATADNFDHFRIGPGANNADVAAARNGWHLWDGQIRQACTVLAAIAKDNSVECVPSDSALQAEFNKRANALKGS